MPSYLHPGVYVEEIPSGVKPIDGVSTSVAAFVGYVARGTVGEPVVVTKWDDYKEAYGGIRDTGNDAIGDPMGHAVSAFFANGGRKAYIVRVAKNGSDADTKALDSARGLISLTPSDSTTTVTLEFTAINAGTWGNELVVRLQPNDNSDPRFGYTLEIGKYGDVFPTEADFEDKKFSVAERFKGLSLDSGSASSITAQVNGSSRLVRVELSDTGTSETAHAIQLSGGSDGDSPGKDEYQDVWDKLSKVRDVSIVCLPGQTWGSTDSTIIEDAISHAETMKNRMVIVDPKGGVELTTEKLVSDLKLPISTYSVLYYPWAQVANPHYNADDNPGAPRTVLAPPCGFAAGMWSKIDGTRGVWKAPAGVEARLYGLAGLQYQVEDAEQDTLNPLGVNCFRTRPNYGPVVWGARTLSTKAKPEWRYVPVRRTAILIEQSIYEGIQWAVFEPNNHMLWASLRANIGAYMDGLFRAGAFQGQKASDAYFVRCGLDDTMTQDQIDQGQVIVIVGFAPLKPAEFVIVRIQQKVGQ